MSTQNFRGDFMWYELMSKDPSGSIAFYPGVTGWTTTAMPNPTGDGEYMMFANNGAPFAGCMQLPAQAEAMQAPSHWLGYVGTPDVDATVAQALSLGGKVYVPAMDIPSVGRIAVLADPQDGTFALFCPAKREGEPDAQPKAPIAWHELMTGDLEAAWSFYSALFGWQKVDDLDMGPMGTYRMFANGTEPIGGVMVKPAELPCVMWNYYAHVADLDASVANAQGGGAQLLYGPMEVPGGDRVAQLVDPQGAMFCLHANGAKA